MTMLMIMGVAWSASSQVNVSGVVLEKELGIPIAYAVVKLGDRTALTNDNGRFMFKNCEVGDLYFKLSYLSSIASFKHHVFSDTSLMFYFHVDHNEITQIVVRGHEHDSNEFAGIKYEISRDKIEMRAATLLSDALYDVNGIRFLKTGNSIAKPIINGMHSNRVAIVNSDSRQEGQQWGSEHAPEVDPFSAGSVEVIKGASTLLYGSDATGGIIKLTPLPFADSTYRQFQLHTRFASNPLGGLFGGQWEKFNRQKHLGQRLSINVQKNSDASAPNYVLSNTGFDQLSGSYYITKHMASHQFSLNLTSFQQQLGILAGAHIGNLTDLKRALASDTPTIVNPRTFEIGLPFQKINHHAAKLMWESVETAMGDVTMSLTHQVNHREEFDRHGTEDKAALDLLLNTTQVNALVDKHFEEWRIEYGAMGERQTNIYKGRYFIPNYLRHKYGVFSVATLKKHRYLLEAGLRFDDHWNSTYRNNRNEVVNDKFRFYGISSGLSAWYRVNTTSRIQMSISSKFRAPDINELFSDGLHHGTANIEIGDLSLTTERSNSLIAAYEFKHERIAINVEPYVHYFKNYINLEPTGETQLTIRGAFPVFRYIQTDVMYSGADAQIQFVANDHWSIRTGGNLVYVRDLDEDRFIYGIPAPQLNGGVTYRFFDFASFEHGSFKLRPEYVFQQNWVDATNDFAPIPQAYFLLNAEMTLQFKSSPLRVLLGVDNLLNNSYRDYLNRYRYFADERGIQFNITINYKIRK